MDKEQVALAKRRYFKYLNRDQDQLYWNTLFDLIKVATSVERHQLKKIYPEYVWVFLNYGWQFTTDNRDAASLLLKEIHICD